jgi:hypothetical protein
MCTISDTKVTTTIIIAVRPSTRKPTDIAVIGRQIFHQAESGQIGFRVYQNQNQRHRHQRADEACHRCMAPKAGAHFFHIDIEHHHHKQEQHHHRAHIHQHQRDAEEFGLHQHPNHGAHTKGQHQIKRGMHRVFSGNGFKRAKQHNGRQHIKQNQGKRHYPAP